MGNRKVSAGTILSVVAIALSSFSLYQQLRNNRNLRVHSLTVTDSKGVARVILAAPVPGPVVQGTQQARSANLAGMILNGPDGNERSGYGTIDSTGEAIITLDSIDGSVEHFKLVSNPQDGASLFLSTRDGGKTLMLSTYTGDPRITKLLGDKEVSSYPETDKQ